MDNNTRKKSNIHLTLAIIAFSVISSLFILQERQHQYETEVREREKQEQAKEKQERAKAVLAALEAYSKAQEQDRKMRVEFSRQLLKSYKPFSSPVLDEHNRQVQKLTQYKPSTEPIPQVNFNFNSLPVENQSTVPNNLSEPPTDEKLTRD